MIRERFPKYLLDRAKQLKVGNNEYTYHDGCTTSNKLWLYHSRDGFGYYCNKCGAKGFKSKGVVPLKDLYKQEDKDEFIYSASVDLPDDMSLNTDDFPIDAKVWLYSADIRNFQIEKYGIGYSKKLHRVILPVYNEDKEVVMWQGRGLLPTQTKYYNVSGIKKSESFFKSWVSYDKLHDISYDEAVLVEDILSVIKVGRTLPTLAALGTSMSTKQYNYLSKFNRVSVWYDPDRGGLTGSDKILKRLNLITECKRIKTNKDPKHLPYNEIKEILSA